MGIRIDKIKVNRGGPLEADFEFEPGDVNLIYGGNETGKTYIVESLIRLLFKIGRRWDLRGWGLSGKVLVSGLEDDPVSFTKTGRKLEDYWEEEAGLPKDLSRILVVKAGETPLAEKPDDGVGRDILKDCLSGEGILDRIVKRIPKTLQEAAVDDGQITGPNRGEKKSREKLQEDVDRVESLLTEAEESYASSEMHSLRHESKRVTEEIAALQRARCHYAAMLSKKLQGLQGTLGQLPSEEQLADLDAEIRLHEEDNGKFRAKSERLNELESTSGNYRWAEKALGSYRDVTGLGASGTQSILLWLGLVALAAVVVLGLLDLHIPSILFAVASVVSFVLYHRGTRFALSTAGESKELERLRDEFQERFGFRLQDGATLEAEVDKLKEDHILAGAVKKEVDELGDKLSFREVSIAQKVKDLLSSETSSGGWRDAIRGMRQRTEGLRKEIHPLELELASLGVSEKDYLEEDPGLEWDFERLNSLVHEQARIENALKVENERLDNIHARLIQETGSKDPDWEHLITALRLQREEAVSDYKEITSEILAKVLLNRVLEEFRQEEDKRISEALTKEELTKPLLALTHRYQGIKHQEESGLVVITDDYEEFPLAEISTGAREQTFMALRAGFASIAMGGNTAFLILDDAFQHSDWQRRENLVAYSLDLSRLGWQIFYFTMDDHLRDLFFETGKTLNGEFQSCQLSTR